MRAQYKPIFWCVNFQDCPLKFKWREWPKWFANFTVVILSLRWENKSEYFVFFLMCCEKSSRLFRIAFYFRHLGCFVRIKIGYRTGETTLSPLGKTHWGNKAKITYNSRPFDPCIMFLFLVFAFVTDAHALCARPMHFQDRGHSFSGAVLVYRYTGEFLLFSYPYMELWRSSLMFRSFVYRYTRTQPFFITRTDP